MMEVMNARLVLFIAVTLILAAAVGTGLMVDAPHVLVAFGAWCGGVLFTLSLQEMLHIRSLS